MNRVNRIVRTARDLETAGLAVLSYYLQLYAIELILEDKSKSEDLRQLASNLLDRVEKFKNEVQSMDDGLEEKRVLSTLLDDQGKAMVYCTNFAMTMYNNNLDKMNTSTDVDLDSTVDADSSTRSEVIGNTADLRKALWCCIDLFSCIIKLWSDILPDRQALQKRIKYCKLCLRKIATVEGNTLEAKLSPADESTTRPTDTENEVNGGDISTEKKLDEVDEDNEIVDREISNMLEKLEKISSEDEWEGKDIRMDDQEPDFIESEDETWREGDRNGKEEEEEGEQDDNGGKPEAETETKSNVHTNHREHKETRIPSTQTPSGPVVHEKYTSSELENMMDRAEKIEKVQKMAKYAISALNYEDIGTAKQELKDALNLLESLQE